MSRIGIIGSTGSIGTQALSVIREQKNKFKIESLSAGKNIALLLKQVAEFKPNSICVEDKKDETIEVYEKFKDKTKDPTPIILNKISKRFYNKSDTYEECRCKELYGICGRNAAAC